MNTSAFDFDSALKDLGGRSGRIRLDPVRYDLTAPWVIDQPCVFLEGNVWAYSSDPNGVFESRYGTQLRLRGRSFPALSIGRTRTAEGCVVRDIGIQGDNENLVSDNVISCSHAESMIIRGNRNILLNNVADRDVVVEGNGNIVSGLFFTTPDAKLIIRGEGNQLHGIPQERVSIYMQ